MKEFLSKNIAETAEIAADFAKELNKKSPSGSATVVGLYGELGSGKTTFMKYLAESFGIKETVQSPTYVIMKIYNLLSSSSKLLAPSFSHLIHIDTYRIEKEEEILNLGWQDIIADPKNLIFIEWPEKISGIMPEHIMIKFEHVSETERKIKINNL